MGVCDSGADYHMSGDSSVFEDIKEIPSNFFVKQIKGIVVVTQWGTVKVSTNRGVGKRGGMKLREVLYMPGMRVNIFSLQRIRKLGSCIFYKERKLNAERGI